MTKQQMSVIDLLTNDQKFQKANGQFNQSEAARAFKIGQPTLNRWLLGTSGVSFEFKLKILKLYDVPPQGYLNGEEIDFLHALKRYLNKHLQ
jgi:transcriptional regulator with XRE-family HTH domain